MWIFIVLFLLTLVILAFVGKPVKIGPSDENDVDIDEENVPKPYDGNTTIPYVPKPYEGNSTIPPATTTPEMPSLIDTKQSTSATDEAMHTPMAVPVGSNVAVLGPGSFEIVAKGDTGSEVFDVLVDGVKYPAEGTFKLSKDLTSIRFETPRRVDLSNVILRDRSPSRDARNVDTNIRVQRIVVNDNGENVRSRLFQPGRDPNFISNGLLFWGGEYTFISQTSDPSKQGNATLPATSGMGTIEIVAKGDVGNEEFVVLVDGLSYPAPAGTLLDDGTISTGKYKLSTEKQQFVIKTPRRVDLSNVIIQFTNDAIDPVTNKDRNIRADLITINGDGVDMRSRLYRTGLDEGRMANLRKGLLLWGGNYTFV